MFHFHFGRRLHIMTSDVHISCDIIYGFIWNYIWTWKKKHLPWLLQHSCICQPYGTGQLPVQVTRFSRNSRSSHWRRVTWSGNAWRWFEQPVGRASDEYKTRGKNDVFNGNVPPLRSFFQRGNSPWKMMGMEDDSEFFWILSFLGVGLFSGPTLNLQGVIFVAEMYFLMYRSQDGHWKPPHKISWPVLKKTSECWRKQGNQHW